MCEDRFPFATRARILSETSDPFVGVANVTNVTGTCDCKPRREVLEVSILSADQG